MDFLATHISNYTLFITGLILLMAQSSWYFYNKKNPDYWRLLGRSKSTQDILGTISGIVWVAGIILTVTSFSTFTFGLVATGIIVIVLIPLIIGFLQ